MDGGVGEVLLDELKEINYMGPVQMHFIVVSITPHV
jgi:hypothetical protein